MSADATQASGRPGPDDGRDAGGRRTLIALCVLSALFFAGALAHAVGGGLLAGDDGDGRADRDARRLPREWANMIPLQPLGPELAAQAEEGDGSSEVAGASAGRGERRPSFAAGAPLAQGPPAGAPLARVVRAPVPVAVPSRPRVVRPTVRTILAPLPRLRSLSPIGRGLPDTPDAPSLPGVPGEVTIPDIDIDVPEVEPFPGSGPVDFPASGPVDFPASGPVDIPPIDPFPGGSPLPPIDPLPGGGGGLPLPGDTGGILLQDATGGSPLTAVRSLGGTEAGPGEAGDSSFDPLVLAAADSSDDEGKAESAASRGEESGEQADDRKPRAEHEPRDTGATRSDRAADAPGKARRTAGRDGRSAGERGDSSVRTARPDGDAAGDQGAPPACPDAEATERRPDEPAGERAEPACRAQDGEGGGGGDGSSQPPRKAGALRPPLDGREPAAGSGDDD